MTFDGDGSGQCSDSWELLRRVADLLRAPAPSERDVNAVLAELAALSPRLLLQLEGRAWFRLDGLGRWDDRSPAERGTGLGERVAGLFRRSGPQQLPNTAAVRLRQIAGLFSRDGYEREWAIKAAPGDPLVARLVAIRTADWVEPVRQAAVARLDTVGSALLVEALPIAVRIESDRKRGGLLLPFLLSRLDETELRSLFRSDDALVRRAAWTRMIELGRAGSNELIEIAGRDPDALVRLSASRAVAEIPMPQRRAVATHFARDAIGYVAAPSFRVLVELDGAAAIEPALTGPSSAVRRSARGWAALRGLDARAIVIERLSIEPAGRTVLLALAELGDRRDREHFTAMLGDARVAVRAAGLRALTRVDEPAARSVALSFLQTPASASIKRVAADVLKRASPDEAEADTIERVALDRTRPAGQRLRALELLRNRRWHYLAATLDAHAAEAAATDGDEALAGVLLAKVRNWPSATITRGPSDLLRVRIAERMGALTEEQRRQIEFVMRTSS